jgi:predicted nucleic acid-binding protein
VKRLVVDASVFVKLFLPERGSELASSLVNSAEELAAPDLIWAECASVLWKRHARGEIAARDAGDILAEMLRSPLLIHDSRDLVPDAMQLAMTAKRTVYDSLYLALAIRLNCKMATADGRLARAMESTPFAKHIRLLAE